MLGVLLFGLMIIIVADYIVLGYVLKSTWSKQIQQIQHSPLKVNIYSAILCYLLLVIGLYVWVVRPKKSWKWGILWGFFVYGVFDLTCKSIFVSYQWSTVFIDWIWGCVLCGGTSAAMLWIQQKAG